jgi:hypothetical protein
MCYITPSVHVLSYIQNQSTHYYYYKEGGALNTGTKEDSNKQEEARAMSADTKATTKIELRRTLSLNV